MHLGKKTQARGLGLCKMKVRRWVVLEESPQIDPNSCRGPHCQSLWASPLGHGGS